LLTDGDAAFLARKRQINLNAKEVRSVSTAYDHSVDIYVGLSRLSQDEIFSSAVEIAEENKSI